MNLNSSCCLIIITPISLIQIVHSFDGLCNIKLTSLRAMYRIGALPNTQIRILIRESWIDPIEIIADTMQNIIEIMITKGNILEKFNPNIFLHTAEEMKKRIAYEIAVAIASPNTPYGVTSRKTRIR